MKRVILESPFCRGHPRGHPPQHPLRTPVRAQQPVARGSAVGLPPALHAWRANAQGSVVYTDLGTSKGMSYGIAAAQASGLSVEYRTLPPESLALLEALLADDHGLDQAFHV